MIFHLDLNMFSVKDDSTVRLKLLVQSPGAIITCSLQRLLPRVMHRSFGIVKPFTLQDMLRTGAREIALLRIGGSLHCIAEA